MSCKLTPYTGLDPNDQTLTAEQKLQACVAFRGWEMNTFVPEMNSLLPKICDVSGVAISAGYLGQAIDTLAGNLISGTPAQQTYSDGDVVTYNNRYYRCLLDGSPFVTDNGSVLIEGSAGGYTYKWVELPMRPQVVLNLNIGASTTAGGQTQRLSTVTVPQTGYYLITVDITPDGTSGDKACYYETNVGAVVAYGSIYNGASRTGIVYLSAGDHMYIDAFGNLNQTNKVAAAKMTAIYLGNHPPMSDVTVVV